MSVSGEGVNFQPSEVLALTYEFRRIFSIRSRGIFIWCTFLKKTNKILRHISDIFDQKTLTKFHMCGIINMNFSMNITINLLPLSLLSALTAPVGYRAEMQDDAHINVASVAMKDTVVNESTVIEDSEIVRMNDGHKY